MLRHVRATLEPAPAQQSYVHKHGFEYHVPIAAPGAYCCRTPL